MQKENKQLVKMKNKMLKELKEMLTNIEGPIQLMFDGKRINNRERMVVVAQFLDSEGRPCEKFVALKSFSDDDSITGQHLFDAMVDELFDRDFLLKVHSSMSDTTAVNTGCRKGINTRLQDYFNRELQHDIHAFECLLHVHELFLMHTIKVYEGDTKAPNKMQPVALYVQLDRGVGKGGHQPRKP